MAMPVYFQGANMVLQPPKGMEDQCGQLPILNTTEQCISCWQLSAEEIAYIARTGLVWLSVGSMSHPPVRVAGEPMVTFEGRHPEIKLNTVVTESGNG